MKLRLFLLFFLLCHSYIAFSETFVVTSNADNGVGTLREALIKAAANGNTEVDYINFNMPGTSPADHTINILSGLPEITSDIVIDASTQPGQEASINHAKVIIDGTSTVYSQSNYHLFSINGVDRFELYGMVIKNFLYTFIGSPTSITALYFSGINKNVTIGAPGKGNVIYNIYGINMNWRTVTPRHQIQNLTLKNNFFGIKENGLDIATTVLTGLNSRRAHNVIIGGNTAEEGNLIYGSVEINFADINELVTQNVSVLVKNNIFTANMNADRPGVIVARNSIYHSFIADANLNHTGTVNIEVTDNVYGAALSFHGLDNCNIRISRNFFGTSRNQSTTLPIQSQALGFYHLNGLVLVGGSSTSEGNVITNTSAFPVYPKDQFAITADHATVELSHNTLYCNPGIPFLYTYSGPFSKPLEVFLKEKAATYVAGTTKAGARVELYYTDPECTNCQPKRYFATVTADEDGNWRYNGTIESGVSVLASATVNKVTSEFSDPRIYMFPYNAPIFKVTHQTCEDEKGKIEGAFTVNVDKIEWLNEAGDVVGTTLDLENLVAGKYKLRANQFGCIIESEWVIVDDRMPQLAFNATAQLIHPSCGNPGSILNLYPNYFSTIQWLNENGDVKGNARELTNVPAGTYTLRLTSLTGCIKDFGPYVLVNASGPNIDQSIPDIKGSSCNTPTGYIKNIQVTGSGTLTYKWRNAAGAVVGSDEELLNVPAGLYTLEVKDGSSCPTLVSTPIEIPEINGITINTANKIMDKATCNSNNGSITGIIVTGATDFKWLDAGGAVVSSSLNLTGMPAGKYRLLASNTVCDKTSEELIIELAQSNSMHFATTKISTPATCSLANGKIEAIFTNDQPVSCFWKNNEGVVVGNSRVLENQGAGAYDLYAIDDLGCEHFLQQYSIDNLVGASINRGFERILNDECGLGKGQIRAPGLSGGQLPYFYEWKDIGGRVLASGAILNGIKAGVYQLTIGDALVCSRQTISYTVNDENKTLPTPVVNDMKICAAGNALIQVLQPINGNYLLYNEAGIIVDQNDKGTFKVNIRESQSFKVVLQQGSCESLAAHCRVTIENDGIGKLANALSPNGDGVNDQWLIPGMQNYPEATIAIYNRYGNKVFESTGYKTPFNGNELAIGTYYYIIDLKRDCGLQKGSLTIIR